MEPLLFFSLLLMVMGGSSMNILQPTGYDCAYAQGGLSQQAGILYDHNMPVEAGGLLLVAAEMDVDRLARMKFFLCPREIPQEVKKPWTFDCTDKIQLDVSRNYQSAMLDWKLQYYLNITFVQVHIPEKFHCNRCGLQIEAEFKKTPIAEPDETETRCSFIHVHEDNADQVTKTTRSTTHTPSSCPFCGSTTTPPSTTVVIDPPITTTSTDNPTGDDTGGYYGSTSPMPPYFNAKAQQIIIAEPLTSLGNGNKKRGRGHSKKLRNRRKGHNGLAHGGKKNGRGRNKKHWKW